MAKPNFQPRPDAEFRQGQLLTGYGPGALIDLPDEYLQLLRYGRGVDNAKLKRAGFSYEYTSAEAVRAFVESVRLRRTVGDHEPSYRYERDVEQFFRHSPAVVRDPIPGA